MNCEDAKKRYEHRIVDACDELHAWATQGDPNGLGLADALELGAFLKMRLDTWGWAIGERSEYDELIRRLAETAAREFELRFDEICKKYASETPEHFGLTRKDSK